MEERAAEATPSDKNCMLEQTLIKHYEIIVSLRMSPCLFPVLSIPRVLLSRSLVPHATSVSLFLSRSLAGPSLTRSPARLPASSPASSSLYKVLEIIRLRLSSLSRGKLGKKRRRIVAGDGYREQVERGKEQMQ